MNKSSSSNEILYKTRDNYSTPVKQIRSSSNISIIDSPHTPLYSPDEKRSLTKRKSKLESDIIILENKKNALREEIIKIDSKMVKQSELIHLKAQTEFGVSGKNSSKLSEMMEEYSAIAKESKQIQAMCGILEEKIAEECTNRTRMLEEKDFVIGQLQLPGLSLTIHQPKDALINEEGINIHIEKSNRIINTCHEQECELLTHSIPSQVIVSAASEFSKSLIMQNQLFSFGVSSIRNQIQNYQKLHADSVSQSRRLLSEIEYIRSKLSSLKAEHSKEESQISGEVLASKQRFVKEINSLDEKIIMINNHIASQKRLNKELSKREVPHRDYKFEKKDEAISDIIAQKELLQKEVEEILLDYKSIKIQAIQRERQLKEEINNLYEHYNELKEHMRSIPPKEFNDISPNSKEISLLLSQIDSSLLDLAETCE